MIASSRADAAHRPHGLPGAQGPRSGPAAPRGRGHSLRAALASIPLLALAGCGGGGSGQTGSAFTFLSVDQFQASGSTAIAGATSSIDAPDTNTTVCAVLRNELKNPTVTASTSLDDVVIQSYTVTLTAATGGALPGPFTFATSVRVPAGRAEEGTVTGNTATVPVIVVSTAAKRDPSVRPPTPLPIAATATIVFRGRNGRGQSVQTEAGLAVTLVAGGTDTACTPSTSATN